VNILKILTIVGARPQFVKAAVVSRAITDHNLKTNYTEIKEVIVHTGQHFDDNMSNIFFKEMQIPNPDYQLGVSGGTHGSMTGQMLIKIEEILQEEEPNIVLVYGDTNSTLAGALAAVKLHIPVAHVEAGLRSFNMQMPEEVNRILTDRVSAYLFCPTKQAVNNLVTEGADKWPGARIYNVGDVMYDAVLYYKAMATPSIEIVSLINELGTGYYLATVHRAENTDDYERFNNIIQALDEIAENTPVILPLHPRARKKLDVYGMVIKNITCIEPVGYFDMLTLLNETKAVFTDSGGLQKEAYFFKKPCITLRDETEWVELVENGFNVLVGADARMITVAERELNLEGELQDTDLYGNGQAGNRIIQLLLNHMEINVK